MGIPYVAAAETDFEAARDPQPVEGSPREGQAVLTDDGTGIVLGTAHAGAVVLVAVDGQDRRVYWDWDVRVVA